MAHVLILGGGFGGVAAASRLREIAPDADVTLVDRGTHFAMGFRKISALVGESTLEESSRPLSALSAKGVKVVQGSITSLDPGARAAEVDGQRIEADAIIFGLGAEHAMEAVPGLAEHGINYYSHDRVADAAAALNGLESGQRLAIGIFGVPYVCPPAPFESALLAQEALRARGVKASPTVFTPQPASLPILGTDGCERIEGNLMGAGIEFRPNAKAERVEKGRVMLEGGDAIPFHVLLAVPPHRAPTIAVEAGLAQQGMWVKVNPKTMETPFEGVYAVGDCTGIKMANDKPMPKAGAFAEGMGITAAERIGARLRGEEPSATFAGEGACFLEVGGGEAMLVRGKFLADPPQVELTQPSKEAREEKARFERERLDAWFGTA